MKEEHTSMDEQETTMEEEKDTTEENSEEIMDESGDEQDASSLNEDEAEESDKTPEQQEIEKLKKEAADWQNRALRAQADLDNVRRRAKEEKENAAKYRAQDLIEALLPVLDNFERAIKAAPENEDSDSLLQGVNMVYSQFYEALQNEGLEIIKTEGEVFDPHQHQAVMQVEEEGFESNQIVEELQTGYKLKDKIIRPAMVKVNA